MDLNAVVLKTRKGQDEIETRAHKLPGRLRAVLIMVDGERTGAELLDQAGELAEQLEQQLKDLIKLGFLEQAFPQGGSIPVRAINEPPSGGKAPAVPVQSSAQAGKIPGTSTWTTVPLEVLKARLGKMLNDSFGMRAMFMTAQLDGIVSHPQLESVLDEMAQSLATTVGADAARKWRSEVRSALGIPG